ncbi:MAG: urease accessory protein [Rhodothermia bacterium]
MNDPIALMAVLSAGFILGLKHATDADHVVAVSTLVNGSDSPKVAIRTGALWGIGHTFTLMLVCLVVVPLNIPISGSMEAFIEGLVGVMLVALGFRVVGRWRETSEGAQHSTGGGAGYRSLFVGAVHGFAGSAALTILILSTVDSLAIGMLYVVVFGLGSMIGMLLFSGFLTIPLRLLGKRAETWAGFASIVTGVIVLLRALP